MIREFFFGFMFGLTFNLIGVLSVLDSNDEEDLNNLASREQRQLETIGALSGMFCNSIIIGLLIYYCYK